MDISNCECGNEISADSYRESGTVNDKYLIIYACDQCDKKGFCVTTNTRTMKGAKVLRVMDMGLHNQEKINEVLREYRLR